MVSLGEKALEFREKAKTNEKPKLTCWKPKFRKAAEDYCRAAQLHYQVIQNNVMWARKMACVILYSVIQKSMRRELLSFFLGW